MGSSASTVPPVTSGEQFSGEGRYVHVLYGQGTSPASVASAELLIQLQQPHFKFDSETDFADLIKAKVIPSQPAEAPVAPQGSALKRLASRIQHAPPSPDVKAGFSINLPQIFVCQMKGLPENPTPERYTAIKREGHKAVLTGKCAYVGGIKELLLSMGIEIPNELKAA